MPSNERGDISRVIITDFYFPNSYNDRSDLLNLSVAFLKDSEQWAPNRGEPLRLEIWSVQPPPYGDPAFSVHAILLSQGPDYVGPGSLAPIAGRPTLLAYELLKQPVITERSPPVATILSELLQHGTALATLVGTDIKPDPLIAMAKVVGGTLIMGATLGLSTGLKRGLAEAVYDFVRRFFGNPADKKKAGGKKAASKGKSHPRARARKAKVKKKRARARKVKVKKKRARARKARVKRKRARAG